MIILLAYFPSLYPDELLYSAIARYHITLGNNAEKQTIYDLFGNSVVCATVDLPSHLGILSKNLNNLYSVDFLIQNHTLFPYYIPFLKKIEVERIKRYMIEGSPWGMVHSVLGIPASKIKQPDCLRFCELCIHDDVSVYHEAYWHRSHQIPGVVVCPKHREILFKTKVQYSTRAKKFEFITLTEVLNDKNEKMSINLSWMDHLVSVAKQSAVLLSLENSFINDHTILLQHLNRRGFITAGGRIRFSQLIESFCQFYGHEFLKFMQCEVNRNYSETWLHKLFRGTDTISHPLRHLLAIRFLECDSNKKTLSLGCQPFGEGPWPCLNKAAAHYGELIIQQCKVTRSSKSRLPVGEFSCDCGFVYSRSGPDNTYKDRFTIGRIKHFGHVWKGELAELNTLNLSLRARASLLGVDPGTVKRQSNLLMLQLKKQHRRDISLQNNIRWERFVMSLKRSKASQVPIRKLNPKDYMWLYRNDKERLFRTMDKYKIKSNIRSQFIDWKQRDEVFLNEVVRAVIKIKASVKPQKITIAAVARTVAGNVPIVLEKNLSKLPKTNVFLKKHLESTEQFQIRRLVWAYEELRAMEYIVQGWKLLKTAGLKNPLLKKVEEKFEELINR